MVDENVPSRAVAVGYMRRTRDYYRALGYTQDYQWAANDRAPFCQPKKPLSQSRVALVTTSRPAGTTKQNPMEVWSGDASCVPGTLYTDDLAWDKITTHTNDTETFLPLRAIQTLVTEGTVGELAPQYHGVPSEYSQRQTIESDAPEILRRVQADAVDAVLLVPL